MYQRIICDASSRYAASCWLRYDSSFRACAAADRSIHWDHKYHDLWLECFTQNASPSTASSVPRSNNKPPRRLCTYCEGLYHFPDNCPQHSFRGAKRPATSPNPTPRHSTVEDAPMPQGLPPPPPLPAPPTNLAPLGPYRRTLFKCVVKCLRLWGKREIAQV